MNRVLKRVPLSLLVVLALGAIGWKITRNAFELSVRLWQREALSIIIESNQAQILEALPIENFNLLTEAVAQCFLAFGRPRLTEEFAKTMPIEVREEFLRRYKTRFLCPIERVSP